MKEVPNKVDSECKCTLFTFKVTFDTWAHLLPVMSLEILVLCPLSQKQFIELNLQQMTRQRIVSHPSLILNTVYSAQLSCQIVQTFTWYLLLRPAP